MGQFLWLIFFGTIMNYLIGSAMLGNEYTRKIFLIVQAIVILLAIYFGFIR